MNTRSIRFRLTLWHAGLLTAVFVLLGALTFFALRHYLEANLRDIQALRARQIADTLLANVGQTGEAFVASEVKTLYAPEANGRFIRIIRGDGSLVYCSGGPKDESFDTSAIPKPPLTESGEFSRKEALPGDKALLIAALSYKGGNGTNYIVEVGAPLMRIRAMLNQLLILLALGLPIVLIAAVGGGLLLVQRALTPVDQIARKAEQITQNSLSERLPVTRTGDELERLSISLNHMIDRLENTVQNSKRFVADASHELRTPLTVLRGELEQLTQDRRLDAGTRESLGSMLEEVERLAKIVEGLVALSRLDAGEAQTEWVPFDLAELAATTADQMNLLAEDKGISVLCEAKQPVLVEGDRARLKQVVVNLLDNAIKYTSGGGKIHLRVARQNGHALLEVEDNGIGIPVEALPHVFERFFRVDKARSRDQGGAGLGLSIVKSICTAHGAEVQVESEPGKGSRFRVKLPLACGEFSKEEIKNENGIKN
jgi:heavy metal sensor kinase